MQTKFSPLWLNFQKNFLRLFSAVGDSTININQIYVMQHLMENPNKIISLFIPSKSKISKHQKFRLVKISLIISNIII